MNNSKDKIILYHGGCSDGFGSAYSAWKKFGDSAEYIPLEYGLPPLDFYGKEIYFLDFLYPEGDLKKLINNNQVFAIDHHKTNQEVIKVVKNYVFDNSKSAAVLSWQYFHPDKNPPYFIQCIQDKDLWIWQLQDSKPIVAYIDSLPFDFLRWDEFSHDLEKRKGEYIEMGNLLLKFRDMLVDEVIKDCAYPVEIDGIKAVAVNSSASLLNDEIGNTLLARGAASLVIIWRETNNQIAIRFRSDDSVDAGLLASKFKGGGGHKKSAGFELPLGSELPWKKI